MHPTSGNAPTWRHRDKEGYWVRRWWDGHGRVERKQRQLRENRWVWEAVTGEKLTADVDIHHQDEDHTNNAFENLEKRAKGAHLAEHGRTNRLRTVDGQREAQCTICERWLPYDHYYKYGKHRNSYCRPCHHARKRQTA